VREWGDIGESAMGRFRMIT